ncbi:DUF4339 domain-containing protein [Mesorhizobium sp. CN2-181]|uniref:DUF4339 domain-containing protein n=1 Tax=Mesorhizobium yinganensis TaxID=3157707 RepID=UPI0032B78CBA
MAEWYYSKDDKPQGPVPADAIKAMVNSGYLSTDTLVWMPKFGTQWRSLGETALVSDHPGDVLTPPPILRRSQETSSGVSIGPQTREGRDDAITLSDEEPPVYAITLALSPIAMVVSDIAFLAAGYAPYEGSLWRLSSIAFVLGQIILAALDTSALDRGGLNPRKRRIVPFVLLTPIAYFWRRRHPRDILLSVVVSRLRSHSGNLRLHLRLS